MADRAILNELTAVSPIDGRYRKKIEGLAPYMSEYALIKARVQVEVAYLVALSEHPNIPVREFTPDEMKTFATLHDLSIESAGLIKQIETKGYLDIKKTNHDVAAVVAYLRRILKDTSLADVVEWIHFGLTSEDINNLAYAVILRGAVTQVLAPALMQIGNVVDEMSNKYAHLPMLSRTHGQPATPTTLGKELRVFVVRLAGQLLQLNRFKLTVKLNGASGNYCAHVAGLPKVDWLGFTERLVKTFNRNLGEDEIRMPFTPNFFTTQIEPHDTYAELFGIIMRINVVLVGFCQDLWRYISDDWLMQTPIEGEVGSSAMPQKVNPIDFENAEGNLLIADALMELFCRKLPISRLQRDLSDSTVERSFGTMFGHCLVAYKAISAGLGKISANPHKIAQALRGHPEVVAEGIQTILRREGVSGSYDLLKEMTRGKAVTAEGLREFIISLKMSSEVEEELLALTPDKYIGLAAGLATS